MAASQKGKFFTLYLLLIFEFTHVYNVLGDSTNSDVTEINQVSENKSADNNVNSALDVINKQQIQLDKLEELVKNLTDLVIRLESRFSYPESNVIIEERVSLNKRKIESDGKIIADEGLTSETRDVERATQDSLPKYNPFWSEKFQFVSAVKIGSNPACIDVLPLKDHEGLSKFVAIGDDRGRVHVLLRNKGVIIEFATSSNAPVTTMLSYLSVHKNESVLITGHKDGVVSIHIIWEIKTNGEDSSSLRVENTGKFSPPEIMEERSPVTVLEVHYIGRKRHILSAHFSGKIRVFQEDGTLYGEANPESKPLAFLKQRLLFLTETGAGSLDLRTMNIRTSECEGLNNSVVKTYIFDATERSKAYGFTSDGNVIHALLLGDIMNFKCRIRSKRNFEMENPLAFEAIKGYLIIANHEKVYVYNVSSSNYIRGGGPRLIFSVDFDDIKGEKGEKGEKGKIRPLLGSDREKLVIVNLGSGYIGMYKSNLPLYKNDFNTMLWTSPVLFFILFLFGAWHFFANKKDALTSWGPDDPFSSSSVTSVAPVASERSFTDGSRSDALDPRGNGLGGPSRRYGSPPRYPGGAGNPYRPVTADTGGTGNSYRPGTGDTGSRPAIVDPNFRITPDLKFRGSNLEGSGFSKRRDDENSYM